MRPSLGHEALHPAYPAEHPINPIKKDQSVYDGYKTVLPLPYPITHSSILILSLLRVLMIFAISFGLWS